MFTTKNSIVGRKPKLRDKIFHLLNGSYRPLTLKEIAESLQRDISTPFRPLKDLERMGLVLSEEGKEGALYIVNKKALPKE